jgi:hypothetical protein
MAHEQPLVHRVAASGVRLRISDITDLGAIADRARANENSLQRTSVPSYRASTIGCGHDCSGPQDIRVSGDLAGYDVREDALGFATEWWMEWFERRCGRRMMRYMRRRSWKYSHAPLVRTARQCLDYRQLSLRTPAPDRTAPSRTC